MQPIKVACVRYLNTMPLIAGLDKLKDVELILTAPSHIASMVSQGNADLGLVSMIDAANAATTSDELPSPLSILPVGMIASDGPTLTVRLFSRKPIDQTTSIHCDSESHTSGVLCKVLLRKLHNIDPDFIEFDALNNTAQGTPTEWPDTILLIGDKVVTDAPPENIYPHQLDLGAAWHDLTHLPFVYATWMCRTDDANSPRIAAAAAILDRQRRHNAARIDYLIDTLAPKFNWPIDLARKYLGDHLSYNFDDRARQAIENFFTLAAEVGTIKPFQPTYADWHAALASNEH